MTEHASNRAAGESLIKEPFTEAWAMFGETDKGQFSAAGLLGKARALRSLSQKRQGKGQLPEPGRVELGRGMPDARAVALDRGMQLGQGGSWGNKYLDLTLF